jgi:hypothetical protein
LASGSEWARAITEVRRAAPTAITTIIHMLAPRMATMGPIGFPVAYSLAPAPGTTGTGAAVGAVAALAGAVADITAAASPVEVMEEAVTDEAGVAPGTAAASEAATRSTAVAAVSTGADFTAAVASMVAAEGMGPVEGTAAVIAKRG